MITVDEKAFLLQKAIGSWVRLLNAADVDCISDKLTIHTHGKLDYTADDKTYCVYSQDAQGHGTNTVSFQIGHVEDVYRQPSGIMEITLY